MRGYVHREDIRKPGLCQLEIRPALGRIGEMPVVERVIGELGAMDGVAEGSKDAALKRGATLKPWGIVQGRDSELFIRPRL